MQLFDQKIWAWLMSSFYSVYPNMVGPAPNFSSHIAVRSSPILWNPMWIKIKNANEAVPQEDMSQRGDMRIIYGNSPDFTNKQIRNKEPLQIKKTRSIRISN